MSEPLEPSESSEPKLSEVKTRALEGLKREPSKSLAGAFVVGLILSLLPIGRIVSLVVNLALMLLRPALVFLGLLKLSEMAKKKG